MNGSRHATAFANLFTDLIAQKHAEAAKTEEFYREYFAVLDLAAEFYLETVRQVFQEHRLARGKLYWRGQLVDPAAIRRTVLLTVEGERDDICGIGQTAAAQDLCNRIPLGSAKPSPPSRRRPLRRVQRTPLGARRLSGRAQRHPHRRTSPSAKATRTDPGARGWCVSPWQPRALTAAERVEAG